MVSIKDIVNAMKPATDIRQPKTKAAKGVWLLKAMLCKYPALKIIENKLPDLANMMDDSPEIRAAAYEWLAKVNMLDEDEPECTQSNQTAE